MKMTAEAVYEKAVSYMGLMGTGYTPMPAASLLEPASADAISAAIVYSDDVNVKISGKPIIPSAVTSLTDKIEVTEKVASTLLPLKTAVILAARYDTELSVYLDRICESFRTELARCRKAKAHPITEEYR